MRRPVGADFDARLAPHASVGRAVPSALLQSRVWIEYQAAWNSASGRAGERGGALAGETVSPRICSSMKRKPKW